MSTLKDTTDGISYPMHSYQKALMDKIMAGGFKPGEMTIISAYRQTGKSMLNSMYGKMIAVTGHRVVDEAIVDNEQWYTVEVRGSEIIRWLREQDAASEWHHTKDISGIYNLVDIKETLYTLLVLRWGR